MTVQDNYVVIKELGDGGTVDFSFSWNGLSNDYVKVYLEVVSTGVQTLQTEGVDYTLLLSPTGVGGVVTFFSAPSSSYYIVITRETEKDQGSPYRTSKGFDGQKVETSLDKLTNILQENDETLERAITWPVGDSGSGTLPSSASIDLKYLYVSGGEIIGSDGTTDTPISAAMTPVVSAATLSDARDELDVYSKAEVDSLGTAVVNDFRLTLTSGLPVTTADVTAASTIYLTPYTGNKISLYSGTVWETITSAEISKVITGLTSGKPYDVFCYNNAGTPTLEFLVWTNDTTRATALVRQDGVLVKSGDTTRRYMGSFYTTGTGTTEDSISNRYLVNQENYVLKPLYVTDSTTAWTYSTQTWRSANGSAANSFNFLVAYDGYPVEAFSSLRFSSGTANTAFFTGIGLDSTSSVATGCISVGTNSPAINVGTGVTSSANVIVTHGKHTLNWLEIAQSGSTQTITAKGIAGIVIGGLNANVRC